MSTKILVISSPDERLDRAAGRALALRHWLDEASFAALVDVVRVQQLAAAHALRGTAS